MVLDFEIEKSEAGSGARVGTLETAHGTVRTPLFMPVATRGAVKGLTERDLADAGTQMVVVNAYHLFVRPGIEVVSGAGGIHSFMGRQGPILSDSGGFQVLSLAKLARVTDEGVEFSNHVDGQAALFTPESVMRIQHELGTDIAMCFDECPPYPAEYERAVKAVERTVAWAERCRASHGGGNQALFGIVQGSGFAELRLSCARRLMEVGFDGYAIGGLGLGEGQERMAEVVGALDEVLPREKPHRHFRLRSADAQRAQRLRLYVTWAGEAAKRALHDGRGTVGRGMQLQRVLRLQPGLPETSHPLGRDVGPGARVDTQRRLL